MIATTDHHYFVMDTSFLLRHPLKLFWTESADKRMRREKPFYVIPHGVDNEWKSFVGRNRLEGIASCQEMVDTIFGNGACIRYNEPLQKELSDKVDAEIDELGLSEKSLSITDKSIIQAAYDLESNGSQVTVVSGDQGIHAEVLNLWKTAGKDIRIISPWLKPSQVPEIDFLVDGNVFAGMKEALEADKGIARYLAIAKGIGFGYAKYDIAFAWYLNRTFQFTPPKIDGVEYVRMIEYPPRLKPETLGLQKMNRIGFYMRDNPIRVWMLKKVSQTPVDYISKARQSNGMKVTDYKLRFELQDWARVSETDYAMHNRMISAKLRGLRRTLINSK